MSIATYADILAATADWLSRHDIDPGRAADFVTLFEAYAGRLLRDSAMEQTETLQVEEGEAVLTLPSDFREGRSLRHGSSPWEALILETPAGLGESLPRAPAGRPARYAFVGRGLVLWPVPDAPCALELVYFGGLCALAAAPVGRTTNWLLRTAPDAYLNGTLAEAADYLDDDRKSAKYAGKRDAALQAIVTNGLRRRWGAGPAVTRGEGWQP